MADRALTSASASRRPPAVDAQVCFAAAKEIDRLTDDLAISRTAVAEGVRKAVGEGSSVNELATLLGVSQPDVYRLASAR